VVTGSHPRAPIEPPRSAGGGPSRFVECNFRGPLDLEARRRKLPSDGTVKGMFFRTILGAVKQSTGVELRPHPYHAFRDYRLSDWVELIVEAGAVMYPALPPRAGLHSLGHHMAPTLVNTTIGKIILTAAGDDLHRAFALYPKLWSVISNHATGHIRDITVGRCVIEQRGVWDFPDSFQVGSLKSGMAFLGCKADVRIEVLSDCDANYEVTW
jgi:uncharacterized protein (TIGR02265 family)